MGGAAPVAAGPVLDGRRALVLVLAGAALLAGGCATFKHQVNRAMAEIHEELKLLHPDDDGLDAFDARTAREIRAMRAELQR